MKHNESKSITYKARSMENLRIKHYIETRVCNIDDLIALCHIIDEFEEFNKKYFEQRLNQPIFLLKQKAKRFIAENQTTYDTIKKYSDGFFYRHYYEYLDKVDDNLEFFAYYISKHKDEIDKILALLEKLKTLGFDDLTFSQDFDFTKEEYCLGGANIYYVDNIEPVPTYQDKMYKSTGSHYEIKLQFIPTYFTEIPAKPTSQTISLNSLTFDSNLLPEALDKTHTLDYIEKLCESLKPVNNAIQNSVNLSAEISDLEKTLSNLNNIAQKLESVESKEELLNLLATIKENIEKLTLLSEHYNDSLSSQNLSPDILQKEYTKYLKRKSWHMH